MSAPLKVASSRPGLALWSTSISYRQGHPGHLQPKPSITSRMLMTRCCRCHEQVTTSREQSEDGELEYSVGPPRHDYQRSGHRHRPPRLAPHESSRRGRQSANGAVDILQGEVLDQVHIPRNARASNSCEQLLQKQGFDEWRRLQPINAAHRAPAIRLEPLGMQHKAWKGKAIGQGKVRSRCDLELTDSGLNTGPVRSGRNSPFTVLQPLLRPTPWSPADQPPIPRRHCVGKSRCITLVRLRVYQAGPRNLTSLCSDLNLFSGSPGEPSPGVEGFPRLGRTRYTCQQDIAKFFS